jgi:hypothetical protein
MGVMLNLNIFPISDLLFLRFLSIVLSLGTLYFSLKIFKLFTNNKSIILLALTFETTLLMFIFISSSVSYDNLTNLLSTMSIYFLIKFFKSNSVRMLLLLLLTMVIGGLTKISYLPLILFELLLIIGYLAKRYYIYYKNKQSSKIITPLKIKLLKKDVFIIFTILIFGLMNLFLYGKNIIEYKQLYPSCGKVFGNEVCLKYRKQSQISKKIRDTSSQRTRKNILDFSINYTELALKRSVGIFGHKSILGNSLLYQLIFVFTLFVFIFRMKYYIKNKQILIHIYLFVSYSAFVLLYNYKGYIVHKIFGAAIQGRYNFPVIASISIILAYIVLNNFKDHIKLPTTMILYMLLTLNGFIWFLVNADQSWFIK